MFRNQERKLDCTVEEDHRVQNNTEEATCDSIDSIFAFDVHGRQLLTIGIHHPDAFSSG